MSIKRVSVASIVAAATTTTAAATTNSMLISIPLNNYICMVEDVIIFYNNTC